MKINMKTQQELLEEIVNQNAEVLKYIKPNEPDDERDFSEELDEISSKIDAIDDHILGRFEQLKGTFEKAFIQAVRSVNNEDDIETGDKEVFEKEKAFVKRRWNFVFIGTTVLSVILIIAFYKFLGLFGVTFGFLLAFIGLGLLLSFDEYVLPGNTLKRISKNGIASAIVFLAFVMLIIGGTSIGNSLITNRDRGEEVTTATSQRVIIEQPKSTRQYDTTSTNKEE